MAYQTTTLAQLRSRLQDRWENRPFWSNVDARFALNEGLRLWNAITGMWRTRATVLTITKDPLITLNASLVRQARAEYNSLPLRITSLAEMDGGYPNWMGQTTNDGGNVPTIPQIWVPISINLIAIWPADAQGGNTVVVDGIANTPVLVNDGDFVDIGDEAHNRLLDYAFHVASFKAGWGTFSSTLDARTRFLKAAIEENDQIGASEKFRAVMGTDTTRYTAPINVATANPLVQA